MGGVGGDGGGGDGASNTTEVTCGCVTDTTATPNAVDRSDADNAPKVFAAVTATMSDGMTIVASTVTLLELMTNVMSSGLTPGDVAASFARNPAWAAASKSVTSPAKVRLTRRMDFTALPGKRGGCGNGSSGGRGGGHGSGSIGGGSGGDSTVDGAMKQSSLNTWNAVDMMVGNMK